MAMNMSMLKKGFRFGKNFLIKQSPVILAVTAGVGVITTVYFAVKDTLKAQELYVERKEELGLEEDQKLSTEETVKTCWKAYIPTAISAGLTIGAIAASSTIFKKRQAALATLYALSETKLKEYQEKIEQELGPKKEQEIRDSINADKVKDIPAPFREDELDGGRIMFKDEMSGRFFRATVQQVQQAAAEINQGIYSGDMIASLNDFYETLASLGVYDVDPIPLGYEVGWNINHFCDPYITHGMTSDMRPIAILDWGVKGKPETDYRDC